MTPLICTDALHRAMKSDDALWSTLPVLGTQVVSPIESLAMRNCPHCHSTLCRTVIHVDVINARLERARREDDVRMVARCLAALRGDLASLEATLEMEQLITTGARRA